jgi:hypothetical protein
MPYGASARGWEAGAQPEAAKEKARSKPGLESFGRGCLKGTFDMLHGRSLRKCEKLNLCCIFCIAFYCIVISIFF